MFGVAPGRYNTIVWIPYTWVITHDLQKLWIEEISKKKNGKIVKEWIAIKEESVDLQARFFPVWMTF